MERSILMKKNTQVRIIFLIVFLCLININSSANTHQSLLLVCDANSTLSYLSPTEIRRLFLNVPVTKDGLKIKPLRNASDPLISEVFLQRVIFLSERSYERKLLLQVFRYGGKNIPTFSSIPVLKAELRQSPGTVTYMWADQVEQDNSVKSLGVLWAGPN